VPGFDPPRALLALMAIVMVLTGCTAARGPARPSPFPGMAGHHTASPESAAWAASLIDDALALRGTPYRLGGERPETGLDCSGLVRFVFAEAGVQLPRTVREQFAAGHRVDTRALRAGDLIFFDIADPGPSHVGIAIGPDAFVHAPGSGGVVRVDRLSAPYWQRRFRGIRRVSELVRIAP
jgi:cell wall-associated NlpC family hydrolase